MDGQMTDEELESFTDTIARLRQLPLDDPVRGRAETAASRFVLESRNRRVKQARRARAAADRSLAARTATGAADRRADAPLPAPAVPGPTGEHYLKPRRCYVCKEPYTGADAFYHRLCPGCASDNAARRGLRTDLAGRRALLTGGRVKIGFQLALMMLRDGAELLVTSRFPEDTLRRFRAAPGSDAWLDRLTVVAVDLRDPRQVLGLCAHLRREGTPLDILVNNAAQTIRRPPASYALLAEGESGAPAPGILLAPGYRPHAAVGTPAGALALVLGEPDEAGLLPDPSACNSWTTALGALDPAEVLETQLVNALAPVLLADRLLPLLLASPRGRAYVVNVSAVEGRFAVRRKTANHPHTNMAKAALNMLTRTSGPHLARQGVHMCAVDTGWVTDENPAPRLARITEAGGRTPLDVVDGAARVYDPIVRGEAGDPVAGVLLKDYREAAW